MIRIITIAVIFIMICCAIVVGLYMAFKDIELINDSKWEDRSDGRTKKEDSQKKV
jgi:hypothetical protein